MKKNRDIQNHLLQAVVELLEVRRHDGLSDFLPLFKHANEEFKPLAQALHPSTSFISLTETTASPATTKLVQDIDRYKSHMLWEQSYGKTDSEISQQMLDGYSFAELVGYNGPFVSRSIRCGFGVWGPYIDYPSHHHEAEEIYFVLGGSATFKLAGNAPIKATSDEVVKVQSNQVHSFSTKDHPVLLLYLWKAGDLRQKSEFQ